MTTSDGYRDVGLAVPQLSGEVRDDRAYIAVVGIDRYDTWNRLYNAVNDAKGILRLFTGLGFELVSPPLLH
jgi:hypothetical protein